MSRGALSTAIVIALLAATAGAFALTERVKLELSPIYGTQQNQVFSPDSKLNRRARAEIRFRVRRAERIDVWVEDAGGHKVVDLVSRRTVGARQRVRLLWDGFTETGIRVPDGVYFPVVKLTRSHRTIVIPSELRLDTTPPKITALPPTKYPILSPDGDGRGDTVRIPYRIDERAQAILLMRGRQVQITRSRKATGSLVWNGKLQGKGALPRGRYVLAIAARDVAGNQSKGVPFAIAQIRYIALARKRVVVRPGGRFAIRVSTDHPTVEWRLNGRTGVMRRGTLRLRAPKRAGVYKLYVTEGSHTAVAVVVAA